MKSETRSILKKLGIAAAAATAVIAVVRYVLLPSSLGLTVLTLWQDFFPYVFPAPVKVNTVVRLENSDWTEEERQWFYHTSQGARLMPYSWFIALEQSEGDDRFFDAGYLTRFRMIPDSNPKENPGLLPVGFARDCVEPREPNGIDAEYVGITCAGCHTGQINYKGKGLLIDGAPSQFDILGFLGRLLLGLQKTKEDDAKFDRFAREVLGTGYNRTSKGALRRQVSQYLVDGINQEHPMHMAAKVLRSGFRLTDSGFGRMDALGMGANTVLGKLNPQNVRTLDSPVDVLPLWNAYSYGWVQTNGAIRQPMARNIVETLSVYAYVDLSRAPSEAAQSGYPSSARLKNVWMMESMASRLEPPVWPTLFGTPDQEKVERGRVLYQDLCADCHEPELETLTTNDGVPVAGPPGAPNYPPDPVSEKAGKRFYHLRLFDVDQIGTDPLDATNFARRTVDARTMGLGAHEPVGNVLPRIMEGIMQNYYTKNNISPEDQIIRNGYRGNYWRTPTAYPARPLAGIWATAPFLHNGSIPNLYELLSPVEERSKIFYRGNLEFDPVRVGFEAGKFEGGFMIDTSQTGNSNAGHEFSDGNHKGVIGRKLTIDERWQIIEYLKVLTFDQQVPPYEIPSPGWTKSMECPQTGSQP
jgi:hypothetical protein